MIRKALIWPPLICCGIVGMFFVSIATVLMNLLPEDQDG